MPTGWREEEQEVIAASEAIGTYVLNNAAMPVYQSFDVYEEESHEGFLTCIWWKVSLS